MHLLRYLLKKLGLSRKPSTLQCRICGSRFIPNKKTSLKECPVCHSLNES